MARPRSPEPRYLHHVTSDRAYVRIAGKQIWLGRYNTRESKDKHRAIVAEWVAKGRPGVSNDTQPPATDWMMSTLIEPYWNHAQTYYKKHGEHTDEVGCIKVVMRLIRRMYGDLPIKQFDSLKLLAMRQEMIRMGWARKTINDHVGRVKRFLKWSLMMKTFPADNYVGCAAVAGLEAGRSDARETDRKLPVAKEHIDAVLPFLSKQVRTMVQLQLLCAARPGEIVQMRKQDIERTGKVWIFRPEIHKLEHHDIDRQICLGPDAQRLIAPFLMRPDDAPLFNPIEAERERREVRHAKRKTPIERGNRPGTNKSRNPKRPPLNHYNVDTYRRAVDRACDAADLWAKGGRVIANDAVLIPHFHPHRLRHTAATNIRAKYGVEAAKLALGVQNMDVAEIYAERDLKVVERVMGEVG